MENRVVFVADIFAETYSGGAELTTEALIEKSPFGVIKIRSQDVTAQLISEYQSCVWIFGNFAGLNPQLVPTIASNLRYAILEYDYKFCQYRSIEKHLHETGNLCNCQDSNLGKLISAFYFGADHTFWMSQEQRDRYVNRFPFLDEKPATILSSVFSDTFFEKISQIKNRKSTRSGWIVLGSKSWIKGADDAEKWCRDNKKTYEVVWDVPYEKMLDKFSRAEGFVYLPKGGDTCPRMVIEAKLLGCDVETNENVQHAKEEWFQAAPDAVCDYLVSRPGAFWDVITKITRNEPTLSGYLTTLDCIKHKYPYEQSILSLLGFCDEVIIVDGGSKDGTWERLSEIADSNPRLKLISNERDWSHKRFAVFDGDQKAVARRHCTGDFCWQMDADEVLEEKDWAKVRDMCKQFPKSTNLLCLPVVEYWGSKEKVRIDVTPWKWRLSRNLPHITHGIPAPLRRFDDNGDLYAMKGTDGCDYIHTKTGLPVSSGNFFTDEANRARLAAVNGNTEALHAYETWYNQVTEILPAPRHFSWIDLERKIRFYRDYWQRHWESLYDMQQSDTSENNMFFDKPWKEVSDQEISELAARLGSEMGGWIFHRKIDWNMKTKSIKIHNESIG
jgi:glycosyltransferase involved in cell wall biosynthesis